MTDELDRTGAAPWLRRAVARRTVLKGIGAGAAATFVELELPATLRAFAAVQGVPRLTVDVVRPDDLLRLRFRLTNLVLDTSVPSQPRLVRGGANVTPLIAVDLGPQHVAEQVLLTQGTQSQGNSQVPPNPPAQPDDTIVAGEMPAAGNGLEARLGGDSRVVFALPDSVTSLPFTLAALLDWNSLDPQVVPVAGTWADPNKPPKPRRPNAGETAIEAPWWLFLSPGLNQAWAHSAVPVTHNGRTELWHSRLASRNGNVIDEANPAAVRAVWGADPGFGSKYNNPTTAADYTKQLNGPFPQDGMPMRMAYTPRDRVDVVRNTSDWSGYNPQVVGSAPQPFATNRLVVSALGAYLDLDGAWPNTKNSLVAWRHRSTLGRDHYVRIVNRGHLYPFGHRAVLVRESDRKFALNNDAKRGAYVLLKFFIVVTEPVRSYPSSLGLDAGNYEGRAFPFQALEVLSRISPTFSASDPVGVNTTAFQPLANGAAITLTFRGTDWEGNTATFAAPFVFVEDRGGDEPYNPAKVNDVNAGYAALAPARRTAALSGQPVAFAPPSKPGDTAFPVDQLVFGALPAVQNLQTQLYKAAGQLAAFPQMLSGLVRLPTVEQLAGVAGLSAPVQFADKFLSDAFGGQNPGQAFLALAQPVSLPFGTENAGGMANPSQELTAITRKLGPVAGALNDIVGDKFDPSTVFNDVTAKILGGIPLKEILATVNGIAQDAEKAMQYVREQLPTEVVVRFKWVPDLQKDPLGIFDPIKTTDPKTAAFIEGEARQSTTNPNQRSWRFHGEITNFRLHLLGDGVAEFLRLEVSKLAFTSAAGQKSQVDVKVDTVTFQGPMKFVDSLRQYLPMLGNALESVPLPQAITASMGIAIPAIAVGVFQLSNLAFSARITIPLTGDPVRVRFAFSSRENPFLLTISFFGGGGFFAVAIGADGVELLEIQFDFGGSFVIDLGVAQGGVDVVAGTYLKLAKANQSPGLQLTIEGFLKLHGMVNVLGIVSVTLDAYLSFQYVHKDGPPARDIASGRVKVALKIAILFFSTTLSVDIQQSFGGDPKDPTFAQTLTANDWADYAAAFAPV